MVKLSIPPKDERRGPEHRRYLRVPMELSVSYRVGDDTEWKLGRSANISVGGVFVVSDTVPAIGTPVACELRQHDSVVLTGSGAVRWHKVEAPKPGFGIQFDTLDKSAHKRLLMIIDDYLQTAPPFPDPEPPDPPAGRDRWVVIAALSVALAVASLAWVVLHGM